MTDEITYPEMRLEVIEAVRALADPAHQHTRLGRYEEGVNYYDDLTLNVHTLYGDCMVLPDPQSAVPTLLYGEEVPAFQELEAALGPMLDDLRDAPDVAYLDDPRWSRVVASAGTALELMQRCDEGSPT